MCFPWQPADDTIWKMKPRSVFFIPHGEYEVPYFSRARRITILDSL